MKRFNLRTIILALTLTALSLGTWQYLSKHTNEANLQRQLQSKEQELTNKLQELEKNKKSNKDYKKQVDKLKKDLQTKRAEERKIAARTSAVVYAESVPEPVGATYHGSGDKYLDWIISRESSGNPYAINASSGACGLFQSLPCSKVLNKCGSLSNVVCQIEWGRTYAISRYGSTYQSYIWWINNNWW